MVLRDGSEGTKNGETTAVAKTVLDVPKEEREAAADGLLFSELGLSRDIVKSEMSPVWAVCVCDCCQSHFFFFFFSFRGLRYIMQLQVFLMLIFSTPGGCFSASGISNSGSAPEHCGRLFSAGLLEYDNSSNFFTPQNKEQKGLLLSSGLGFDLDFGRRKRMDVGQNTA